MLSPKLWAQLFEAWGFGCVEARNLEVWLGFWLGIGRKTHSLLVFPQATVGRAADQVAGSCVFRPYTNS